MTLSDKNICDLTLPDGQRVSLANGRFLVREDLERIPIVIPTDISDHLRGVSQLGLKDMYFAQKPGTHNRWEHSKGAYTNGMIWLEALYEDDRIPDFFKKAPYPSLDEAKVLAGYSLLLHDYGHLFFSHLLEEAMHSMNWVPIQKGISTLEYTVLKDRLSSSAPLTENVHASLTSIGAMKGFNDPSTTVLSLINGWSGLTWLQCIINGPVDADKIDYLRRDQDFLRKAALPTHTRLNFGGATGGNPWFNEFLSEQYVNHTGFLCLSGRSAVAAADLWRERLFLYDRFYLAPAIRCADRMALEIVQQFLIHMVLSRGFLDILAADSEVGPTLSKITLRTLSEEIATSNTQPIDVVDLKYRLVTRVLASLSAYFAQGSRLDWACLDWMYSKLAQAHANGRYAYEPQYADLLESAWRTLDKLSKGQIGIDAFASDCILGAPIVFPKPHRADVQRVVRGFQHQYCNDVFVDVALIPPALSVPNTKGYGAIGTGSRFCGILVPTGKTSSWDRFSRALEPLTDDTVADLEIPFGRVTLISPKEIGRTRRMYLFDRLVGALKVAGIAIQGVEL